MHSAEALASTVKARNHTAVGAQHAAVFVTTDATHGVVDDGTDNSNVEGVAHIARGVAEEALVEAVALRLCCAVVVVERRLCTASSDWA